MKMYSLDWSIGVWDAYQKSHPRVKLAFDIFKVVGRDYGLLLVEEDLIRALLSCIRFPKHGGKAWREFKTYIKMEGYKDVPYTERVLNRLLSRGRFCKEELDQLDLFDEKQEKYN